MAWLAEYAAKFGMEIDAYVLITHHAHILATSGVDDSIPDSHEKFTLTADSVQVCGKPQPGSSMENLVDAVGRQHPLG